MVAIVGYSMPLGIKKRHPPKLAVSQSTGKLNQRNSRQLYEVNHV